MSEVKQGVMERLSLVGQFSSKDRRRYDARRLLNGADLSPLSREEAAKNSRRWEQTIKNVRDGFPAGSKERAVMEDFFAPVFGLPYPESERFKTDGLGSAKASKGELAQKHGLVPSALSKLLHQIRELNWAEYNRLSNQQEEQHG